MLHETLVLLLLSALTLTGDESAGSDVGPYIDHDG